MDQWARDQIAALEQRVAALERAAGAGGGSPTPPDPEVDPQIIAFLREGKEVQALKAYVDKTGADLTTAKAAVARMAAQL